MGKFITKHGMKGTPEYDAYHNAMYRCNNPKAAAWKNYGGRGIKFLFTSFEQFYVEIGPRPSSKHSLDRKDNDGNYESGNVRWSTKEQQNENRRSLPRPGAKKASLTEIICYCCGKVTVKLTKAVRHRRKNGYTRFFCNRSCGAKSSKLHKYDLEVNAACQYFIDTGRDFWELDPVQQKKLMENFNAG